MTVFNPINKSGRFNCHFTTWLQFQTLHYCNLPPLPQPSLPHMFFTWACCNLPLHGIILKGFLGPKSYVVTEFLVIILEPWPCSTYLLTMATSPHLLHFVLILVTIPCTYVEVVICHRKINPSDFQASFSLSCFYAAVADPLSVFTLKIDKVAQEIIILFSCDSF